MKIRRPLQSDPEKAREWQRRSQEKALARLRERGQKLAPKETEGRKPVLPVGSPLPTSAALRRSKPGARKSAGSSSSSGRQNDGPWRNACIMARGEMCRCCLTTSRVQMDHIKPKGQGGQNDVENGLPLCEEHHRMKTDSQILIEWAWLDPDQIEYLARIGWVEWDADGQPFGRGYKHFAPRRGGEQREGGQL